MRGSTRTVLATLACLALLGSIAVAQDLPDHTDDDRYALRTTNGSEPTIYKNQSQRLANAPPFRPDWTFAPDVDTADVYISVVNHTFDGTLCVSPRTESDDDLLLNRQPDGAWSFDERDGGARENACYSRTNLTFPIYLDIPTDLLSRFGDGAGQGLRVRLRTYQPSAFNTNETIADIPVALQVRQGRRTWTTLGHYWPGHEAITGPRWVQDPFIQAAAGQFWPALVIRARADAADFVPGLPADQPAQPVASGGTPSATTVADALKITQGHLRSVGLLSGAADGRASAETQAGLAALLQSLEQPTIQIDRLDTDRIIALSSLMGALVQTYDAQQEAMFQAAAAAYQQQRIADALGHLDAYVARFPRGKYRQQLDAVRPDLERRANAIPGVVIVPSTEE
ncbi:MAG: hypothetical protein AAF683_06605 [Pseudomonadota bacterium]